MENIAARVQCKPPTRTLVKQVGKAHVLPLRILFVQAKRVWNPQVFRQISVRPLA